MHASYEKVFGHTVGYVLCVKTADGISKYIDTLGQLQVDRSLARKFWGNSVEKVRQAAEEFASDFGYTLTD